jgi:chromatin segregation and condensation protein Rec8/ScpA/Scc1 (kleisin family)
MARLSAEQKEANKIASKERTQAFNARRKAYREALDAAEAEGKRGPEYAELEAARETSEQARASRIAALAAIDEQIAQLQAQRQQVEAEHGATRDAAKQRYDTAWFAQDAVLKQLRESVNARFPDMVGVWYQSQWRRPEGV